MGTSEDLAATGRMVQDAGRDFLGLEADVRDREAVQAAVDVTLERFGQIDFVLANAGIMATTGDPSREPAAWTDSIDTMLSGVFYTLQATTPSMIERNEGGSIIITSSTSGLRGVAYKPEMLSPGQLGYAAAKHGVVGLMRNYAMALGPYRIRVNSLHPMGVNTPMVVNDFFGDVLASAPPGWMANVFSQGLIEPRDVSDAVLWLCSEESRFVTGSTIKVDSGQLLL
jgi:NAD(P)-dependent dehydrogenase (short-subunit alcohol dehydrogenase family)